MEIRARYTLIGAFTLAVIGMVFAFIYWLHNGGALGQRQDIRVVFGNSVSGLLNGSPVFFNGIRVGEVRQMGFRADNPAQLEAIVAVDPSTPLRTDTKVGLDFQGLTGVAVIMLSGGSADAPPLTAASGTPVLFAPPGTGESLTQAAQNALQRLQSILDESTSPIRSTLDNVKSFTDALARNSDRVDGIMAGLERMTGGAGKTKGPTYDLLPARGFPESVKAPEKQLTIAELTAPAMFDNDKIALRKTATETVSVDGGQWSDPLPRLLQLRFMQSFENAGFGGSIGRAAEGVTGDFQLLVDLRSFLIATEGQPTAQVSFGAKLLDSDGKIVSSKIFEVSAPVATVDAPTATAALNTAFGDAAKQLVVWVSESLANRS
jgi:phospholipid/cholesterol/gamma-HCH transport system substrate-binding protein